MDIKIIVNLIRFVTNKKLAKKRESIKVMDIVTTIGLSEYSTRFDAMEEACPSISEE